MKKSIWVLVVLLILIGVTHRLWLGLMGEFLVAGKTLEKADAVVVLSTGMAYYPRLMQAASLYRKGLAGKVVVNGNRKSPALRELEAKGMVTCCPWYEKTFRILELLQVPRRDMIAVSAEDAYDTVSESRRVGGAVKKDGFRRIIVTSSKFHSRRALFIWRRVHGENFAYIGMSPADKDPFKPHGWWQSGRQIKWVLAEYGAWLYLLYKGFDDSIAAPGK